MKISSIKQNIIFTNAQNNKDTLSNKKATLIIPLIVLASSPLTDSCSRIEPFSADIFEKQDTTEVVETPEPGFDVKIDTTTNTIIHEITI